MDKELTNNTKEFALQLGAELVGIADLKDLSGIETVPADLLDNYSRALVIAFQIAPDIFEQIDDNPTPIYAQQYKAVNQLLDQINLRIQSKLLCQGYRALAIPASQTVDQVKNMGQVPAKALAILAGLGWQGKSSLLVTPQYGPRVRISCLLTNAPLIPDASLANRCGSCLKCKDACPAGAIIGMEWPGRLRTRDEALDLNKCLGWVNKIEQLPQIGAKICGICIKVCPWGRVK